MKNVVTVIMGTGVMLSSFAAIAAPEEITTPPGVKMILIPTGAFTMGNEDGEVDEPEHEAAISSFYIDKYEGRNPEAPYVIFSVASQ